LEKNLHNYIYDYMYERYCYDDQFVCRFGIDTAHFSSLDDFMINQVFLYVSALYGASNGKLSSGAVSGSISQAIANLQFSQEIPFQRIQIQSKGSIVLYSKNIVPLVIGILIAMSSTLGGVGHRKADICC
jgi:hypothetical protein